MKAKRIYIVLFLFLPIFLSAETISLRSGQRISGTVIFENEEVIVIKDADGTRYQYPKTEIVKRDTQEIVEDAPQETKIVTTSSKKVGLKVDLSAAPTKIKSDWGCAINADLLVGATNLMNKHIFLGGGLGYHAIAKLADKSYSFIPIELAVFIPLMNSTHAPFLGLDLGYGIALSKQYSGGLSSGLDFGYRCQLNNGGAIFTGINADLQMSRISTKETINNTDYYSKKGITFCSVGLKFAIQL